MNIFVLIVIMHVSSGSIINFQEFNSIEQCQYAARIVKEQYSTITERNISAFCVRK